MDVVSNLRWEPADKGLKANGLLAWAFLFDTTKSPGLKALLFLYLNKRAEARCSNQIRATLEHPTLSSGLFHIYRCALINELSLIVYFNPHAWFAVLPRSPLRLRGRRTLCRAGN